MVIPRIFKDTKTVLPFGTSFFILVVAFSVAYMNLKNLSNLLVVHFDVYKGIDFLGNKTDVFNVLYFGGIVIILNMILAHSIYLRERFLAYVLAFISPVFSALIFISVLAIISIN